MLKLTNSGSLWSDPETKATDLALGLEVQPKTVIVIVATVPLASVAGQVEYIGNKNGTMVLDGMMDIMSSPRAVGSTGRCAAWTTRVGKESTFRTARRVGMFGRLSKVAQNASAKIDEYFAPGGMGSPSSKLEMAVVVAGTVDEFAIQVDLTWRTRWAPTWTRWC